MKYPRIWENKLSGDRLLVMPWWEMLDKDTVVSDQDVPEATPGEKRKFKIGALVQIGYLLENVHGIWIGVGPRAAEGFIDLGEPSPKLKPRKGRKKK